MSVSRHRLVRRLLTALLGAAVAGVVAGGAGFAWFIRMAEAPMTPPPHADGIVVLTGGAERVETGLHLLAEGQAGLLLVSGVGHGSELADLARLAGMDAGPMASRIELGRSASSTRGNALETRDWARRRGVTSLIVVTAGYHMQRALQELGRVLPDVVLYPAAVQPPALRRRIGLAKMRLLGEEYMKFLASWMGVSLIVSPGPAQAGGRLVVSG